MQPLNFLVLEDDAKRREQLVTLLRGAEHQVVGASSGAIAAEAISGDRFDALLLDLRLPDLDLSTLRQALSPSHTAEPDSLASAERRHLALVLRHTSGNKRKAAHLLGISRSTLLNKVRKYGLVMAGVLAGTLSWSAASAQDRRPVADGQLTSGTLSFDGHATVGDFVGTTQTVAGKVSGAGDLTEVPGWVEAPVKSLKTGNTKRDKDLNKSMESDQYPVLRFDLVRVSRTGGEGDSLAVVFHGKLTLHGVTRDVDLPGTIRQSGPTARVRTDFPLNLKDYHIGGLSKLLGVLKMSENIEVHGDLVFRLGPATAAP
jgi:polyisoprenoid-binding protein YceI/CheY-like chemotaxis protein